jgi:hypothetical protein
LGSRCRYSGAARRSSVTSETGGIIRGMSVAKDTRELLHGEPPGQRTNAIRWLQKKVMRQALELPRRFDALAAWSGFDDVESLTRRVYGPYGKEELVDFRAEVHEYDITGPFAGAPEAFLLRLLGPG